MDRLLRMRRGGQVELQSGTDLDPVWREISEISPGGYRFTVLQDGPPRWRMQVTRRLTRRPAARIPRTRTAGGADDQEYVRETINSRVRRRS